MKTEAEKAADEAIARVRRSLTDDERLNNLLLIGQICERQKLLTTDDIPFEFPPEVDSRVSGALMREAANEGFCEPVDDWQKSGRVTCHARPKRVWRSRLC